MSLVEYKAKGDLEKIDKIFASLDRDEEDIYDCHEGKPYIFIDKINASATYHPKGNVLKIFAPYKKNRAQLIKLIKNLFKKKNLLLIMEEITRCQ